MSQKEKKKKERARSKSESISRREKKRKEMSDDVNDDQIIQCPFCKAPIIVVELGEHVHANPETSFASNIIYILSLYYKTILHYDIVGPPAWKQLSTWYQVSESDRIIPPDVNVNSHSG
jgi:hypothetical protein